MTTYKAARDKTRARKHRVARMIRRFIMRAQIAHLRDLEESANDAGDRTQARAMRIHRQLLRARIKDGLTVLEIGHYTGERALAIRRAAALPR